MKSKIAKKILQKVEDYSFMFADFQKDLLKQIIEGVVNECKVENERKSTKAAKSSKIILFKKRGSRNEE